jgi:hypothetical protein
MSLPDAAKCGHAIQARHLDVEYQQMRPQFRRAANRLRAILDFCDAEPDAAEQPRPQGAHIRGIISHENDPISAAIATIHCEVECNMVAP